MNKIFLNNAQQYENNPEQYTMKYKRGITMKLKYYLELELEIHGDYSPAIEEVASLNIPPEDCYPGCSDDFDLDKVYILITNEDKTITKIKCPDEIIDLIPEYELDQLAREEYNETITDQNF